MIKVSIANRQEVLPVDIGRLRRVLRALLGDHGIHRGTLGVAIVDDETIAHLHARWLDDPEPTDVLSFPLGSGPGMLDGEVIASAETAIAASEQYGLAPADELLLYVIHGTLHLLGYDDRRYGERARMRHAERVAMRQAGIDMPHAPERPAVRARGRNKSPGRGTRQRRRGRIEGS
ncbi:MAG: rRNA maturation RNase YbeY [Planctomycetota bacterium]